MIKFSRPLIEGTLIKRYKRFFADVALDDGQVVTSHCPNTGSMRSCGAPGDRVLLLPNDDPKRKLRYTWEYTKTSGGYIGINTQRPNRIVEAAIRAQKIIELQGYPDIRREVAYGQSSKIDLLLSNSEKGLCYVEIKNVTLLEGETLYFPDAVTTRGLKHLHELMAIKHNTPHRAVLMFCINRPDGIDFQAAAHIDPAYSQALLEAKASGIEILCYRVAATQEGLDMGAALSPSFIDSHTAPMVLEQQQSPPLTTS